MNFADAGFVSREVFNARMEMKLLEREQAGDGNHQLWRLAERYWPIWWEPNARTTKLWLPID